MGNDLSIRQFSAGANKPVQPTERKADIREFPATGSPRKPAVSTLVNQGTRDSIVAQVCVFGKTCGQIARQMGLDRSTIETVLIQELSKKCANEYRRGYQDGRRPNPPASTLRPELLRRVA